MRFLPLFLSFGLWGGVCLALPLPSPANPIAQATSNTNALSEEAIRQMMAKIEQAEQKEDIKTLMSFLAPFIVSEITVTTDEQTTTRTLEGLGEHQDLLQSSYNRVAKREVLEKNTQIRLTEDGQLAIVKRRSLRDVTTEDKKKFLSFSEDTIRVAMIGGQPKIVSIRSEGWLEERP
ncbi:hypothetical protein [Synechocystis sp. LKSZ1]|uniref:hypothetical protein n=1 Tax=Synechocystis sp. LKSZ1 TaxID=3144951 RepID=UPI00336BC201